MWYRVLILVLMVIFVKAKETRKSLNMDPIDVSVWGLPTRDQYPDMIELSEGNFKTVILNNGDAWIIVFHKGTLHSRWSSIADRLKGSVWIGTVNVNTQPNLAKLWVPSFIDQDKRKATSIVFPYGKSEKKKMFKTKSSKQASMPAVAENLLVSSSSLHLPHFDFTPKNMEAFQKWVVNSYYIALSPKFTMLCLVEDAIPTAMHSIKMYFNDFFSFGVVLKQHVSKLRLHFKDVPEPQVYPHYLLLLGREPTKNEFDSGKTGLFFDVLPFNVEKYGDPTDFTSIVKFLFTANEDFRQGLPGRRSDETAIVTEMQPIQKALRDRISAVDGVTLNPKVNHQEL